jgi:hypothetical protein
MHQVSDLREHRGYRFLKESPILYVWYKERDTLERINDDCIEYGPDRMLLQVFNRLPKSTVEKKPDNSKLADFVQNPYASRNGRGKCSVSKVFKS